MLIRGIRTKGLQSVFIRILGGGAGRANASLQLIMCFSAGPGANHLNHVGH